MVCVFSFSKCWADNGVVEDKFLGGLRIPRTAGREGRHCIAIRTYDSPFTIYGFYVGKLLVNLTFIF